MGRKLNSHDSKTDVQVWSIWKDAQYYMLLGNFRLIQMTKYQSTPIGTAKIHRTWQMPTAGESVGQQVLSFIPGRNANGTAILLWKTVW